MRAAFETRDRFRDVRECPYVDPSATSIMVPLWNLPGDPGFMEYRKYERTQETHEGCPLFREIFDRQHGKDWELPVAQTCRG